MFGRKRRDARAVEAIREQLTTAELYARAVLTEALEQMETRLARDLDQRKQLQRATQSAIKSVEGSLSGSATEIVNALEQVANMCAVVADRLEADRLERHEFVEAVARLTRSPARELKAPSRIIGGTFYASADLPDDDTEISLVDDDDPVGRPVRMVGPSASSDWAATVLDRLSNGSAAVDGP